MRKHHLYPGIIVFAVTLMLVMRGELQAQTTGSLTYGQTVNGSTASTGTENWTFSGSEGDVIVVNMDSTEFDPYVELRGPDGVLGRGVAGDEGGSGDEDGSPSGAAAWRSCWSASAGIRIRPRNPPGWTWGSLPALMYRRIVGRERPLRPANSSGER